jgi:hypothetical protein
MPPSTPLLNALPRRLPADIDDPPRCTKFTLERLGRLDHPAIKEASGIVASRKYPGIFWVHNDSGNPPALFAVRRDGSLVREYKIAAPNVDWEDIAADDAGHLFLGDIGNNGSLLPIRVIHRLDEPNPEQAATAPLAVTASSHYRFPSRDQRFDAESLFIEGSRAIVISKRYDGRPAELFAIPLDPPAPLLRPALPERIGALDEFVDPATGASLSANGKCLAVCSGAVTRVYDRTPAKSWRLLATVRYEPDQIEAITWQGKDLILASEKRGVYRIPESKWSGVEERRVQGAGRKQISKTFFRGAKDDNDNHDCDAKGSDDSRPIQMAGTCFRGVKADVEEPVQP